MCFVAHIHFMQLPVHVQLCAHVYVWVCLSLLCLCWLSQRMDHSSQPRDLVSASHLALLYAQKLVFSDVLQALSRTPTQGRTHLQLCIPSCTLHSVVVWTVAAVGVRERERARLLPLKYKWNGELCIKCFFFSFRRGSKCPNISTAEQILSTLSPSS